MKQLIQSAVIADPRSPHHGKKRDLLIARGRIEEVAATIVTKAEKVEVLLCFLNRLVKKEGSCLLMMWIWN